MDKYSTTEIRPWICHLVAHTYKSHLLPEQQNELIQALILAVEQFKNVQESACPFVKYLKKEDGYIIKALITSERLTKSLTKLLTLPAYLEYSLNQQKSNA